MERDKESASKLVKQKKIELAKLLLRKKKFLEHMSQNAHGELENIEKMIETVDLAHLQKEVVQGLKEGNSLLKEMQSVMKIEDVEKVMEETREQVEFQKEVNAILSGHITDEDETEIEEEFEKILSDQLSKQLPEVPTSQPEPELNLPEVPKQQSSAEKSRHDQEPVMLPA